METHYDAIVVGAGLAGLTAATRLAQTNHRVLVLERNPTLGGRARTDDLDGWLFNQGGHALYRNTVGHRTLQQLGIEPSGEAPPLAGGQVVIDGQPMLLPLDPKGVALTKALSFRGKVQFAKLLTALPKLDLAALATVTVDDWLADYRDDVQALIKAVVRLSTYSAATDVMSADAAVTQLADGAEHGVMYLHGGWQALVDELASIATRDGATIMSGAPVESIEASSRGFRIASGEQSCTATTIVIAAGGPSLTARMLGVESNAFGDTGPAPEAAVLDLALDAMPARHRFMLGVDKPTYFSVQSPPAQGAPAGAVAAVAMRYISPDNDGSADEHRAELEAIAELAGCPAPVKSRFLRRMTVTHGQPIAAAGGMAGRPGVAVPGLDGAFVAGDWVGARGLLADASIASGHEAADAAARVIAAVPSAH